MSRLTEVARAEDGKSDLFGFYWDGEMYWAQYGVGTDMPEGPEPDPDQDMPDTTDPWSGWTGDPEAEGVPPPEDQGEPSPPPAMEEPDVPTEYWNTYVLDRAGNRTNVVGTGGNRTYVPNILNQYTQAESVSVVNGGEHEVRDYQGVHYEYINDERLKSVTSPGNSYYLYYDALGRCVKRTLNGATTYYIYDGEKPIVEYNSAGTIVGRNLYGKWIDEILMRTDTTVNGGQPFYYQQDRNQNVTHLTNASGAVIEKYKYDAFGKPTIYAPNGTERSTSLYKNRFLFTGREYAATFGFYEYRARAYSPTLGRFMSEDPKGFVRRVGLGTAPADWTFGTHPDEAEYNLFRYCANDPIDFTDPLGLESPAWAQAIIPGQTEWDSAVANFQAGNYGNAVGWTAAMVAQQYLAVATLGTSMRVQQSVQGARVASQEVSAVIGKFPNYLKVADKLGAKRFNIPPAIWNRMTDAERWGANQRFLDRAIARRGDIMLDKPIKSIESVSGQLRRELDYVAQKGYTLSEDGSRMRPPPPEMSP